MDTLHGYLILGLLGGFDKNVASLLGVKHVVKHIVWVFIATVFIGSFVMELPTGVARLSVEGIAIVIGGPLVLCFLPSVAIFLIVAGMFFLAKKHVPPSLCYLLWGIWSIPTFLIVLGAAA